MAPGPPLLVSEPVPLADVVRVCCCCCLCLTVCVVLQVMQADQLRLQMAAGRVLSVSAAAAVCLTVCVVCR